MVRSDASDTTCASQIDSRCGANTSARDHATDCSTSPTSPQRHLAVEDSSSTVPTSYQFATTPTVSQGSNNRTFDVKTPSASAEATHVKLPHPPCSSMDNWPPPHHPSRSLGCHSAPSLGALDVTPATPYHGQHLLPSGPLRFGSKLSSGTPICSGAAASWRPRGAKRVAEQRAPTPSSSSDVQVSRTFSDAARRMVLAGAIASKRYGTQLNNGGRRRDGIRNKRTGKGGTKISHNNFRSILTDQEREQAEARSRRRSLYSESMEGPILNDIAESSVPSLPISFTAKFGPHGENMPRDCRNPLSPDTLGSRPPRQRFRKLSIPTGYNVSVENSSSPRGHQQVLPGQQTHPPCPLYLHHIQQLRHAHRLTSMESSEGFSVELSPLIVPSIKGFSEGSSDDAGSRRSRMLESMDTSGALLSGSLFKSSVNSRTVAMKNEMEQSVGGKGHLDASAADCGTPVPKDDSNHSSASTLTPTQSNSVNKSSFHPTSVDDEERQPHSILHHGNVTPQGDRYMRNCHDAPDDLGGLAFVEPCFLGAELVEDGSHTSFALGDLSVTRGPFDTSSRTSSDAVPHHPCHSIIPPDSRSRMVITRTSVKSRRKDKSNTDGSSGSMSTSNSSLPRANSSPFMPSAHFTSTPSGSNRSGLASSSPLSPTLVPSPPHKPSPHSQQSTSKSGEHVTPHIHRIPRLQALMLASRCQTGPDLSSPPSRCVYDGGVPAIGPGSQKPVLVATTTRTAMFVHPQLSATSTLLSGSSGGVGGEARWLVSPTTSTPGCCSASTEDDPASPQSQPFTLPTFHGAVVDGRGDRHHQKRDRSYSNVAPSPLDTSTSPKAQSYTDSASLTAKCNEHNQDNTPSYIQATPREKSISLSGTSGHPRQPPQFTSVLELKPTSKRTSCGSWSDSGSGNNHDLVGSSSRTPRHAGEVGFNPFAKHVRFSIAEEEIDSSEAFSSLPPTRHHRFEFIETVDPPGSE